MASWFAFGAALATIAGVFLPWGRVALSGDGYRATVLVNGSKIGADLGGAPWGWLTLACGIAGAIAIWRSRVGLGALVGLIAVALASVNLATVGSSHVDGHLASIIPRGVTTHVSAAWGSWVVLGTSLALLLGAASSLAPWLRTR